MFQDGLKLESIREQFSHEFSKFISFKNPNHFKAECWDLVVDKILSSLVQHIFTIKKQARFGPLNVIKHSVFCNSDPKFQLKKKLVDYLNKIHKTRIIVKAIKVRSRLFLFSRNTKSKPIIMGRKQISLRLCRENIFSKT